MPTLSRDNIKEAIKDIGVVKVAKLCGRGRNAVSNWYRRGFPPETYLKLAPRLRRRGWEFEPEDIFNNLHVAPKPQRKRGRR